MRLRRGTGAEGQELEGLCLPYRDLVIPYPSGLIGGVVPEAAGTCPSWGPWAPRSSRGEAVLVLCNFATVAAHVIPDLIRDRFMGGCVPYAIPARGRDDNGGCGMTGVGCGRVGQR